MATRVALGLDFGTESVRVLLVDLRGRDDALLDEVAAEPELVPRVARLDEIDEALAERGHHVAAR